jgi:mannose-6-phosphate isomerase-like protein (cupin superfamily)
MKNNSVFNVFGETVEILVASKATNYTFCTAVQTSPPGGGPPPHKHEREEELFMVLEGEFEFFDGQSWSRFEKNEVKYSMRGNFHAFRNSGSKEGKILFTTIGGGIDEYFETISHLKLPDDMQHLIEISRHYGYEFAVPAPILP